MPRRRAASRGDSPGFPVTIDGSGGRSYRLTSDLAVGSPNLDGLVLATTRLTVDFNGLSLVGYALGTGTGRRVAGSGAEGALADLATLKNGTIRGARGLGIELTGSNGVQIENLVIDLNAGGGISVGERAELLPVSGAGALDRGDNYCSGPGTRSLLCP